MPASYQKPELVAALRKAGAVFGATVFCHSNIGHFGRAEGISSLADLCAMVLDSFREALGERGTLVVPTFSYSFGSNRPKREFDLASTPSACGAFSEYVRKSPGARRSLDPMFSVAAIGARAEELVGGPVTASFGEDSFWRRFLDANGQIVNLNCDAASTFIHFVERRLEVPYRADRKMSGMMRNGDVWAPAEIIFNSRDLTDLAAEASFELFDKIARHSGKAIAHPVGKGEVVSISARETEQLIVAEILANPRFLTVAGKAAAV